MDSDLRKDRRGAFFLIGDHLYIANDGNGFDRLGVIALCMANLSGKSGLVVDDHSQVPDQDWIEIFSQHQLSQYISHRNRIQTDFKEEESTVKQYSGRWLLELLQNIDDALGSKDESKYIGTKGLGFLSVMEIAHTPEIFSGHFNFCFSSVKTREALLHKGVPQHLLDNTPNFQVPWPAQPDKKVSEILSLGFKTVIKLYVREDRLEDVTEQLSTLKHHFLLFAQNLDQLTLSINDVEDEYSRIESHISGDEHRSKTELSLSIKRASKKPKIETWIRWKRSWDSYEDIKKRSSCMFCLEKRNGDCVPFATHTKAYNFYPTEESSQIRGFLHMSFDLTRDRKRFLIWGKQNVSWNGNVCAYENQHLVRELVSLITEDVIDDPFVPIETVIKTFSSLTEYLGKEEQFRKADPLNRVKWALIEAIVKHPFVPTFSGSKTSLESLRSWEAGFIECLKESEEAADWNLAPKRLEPLFDELTRYHVPRLNTQSALDCLAECPIKNSNAKNRRGLANTILHYISEANFQINSSYFYKSDDEYSLFNIPFLTNNKNELVALGSQIFVQKDVAVPSFVDVCYLSSESAKHLQRMLDAEIEGSVRQRILSRFIVNPWSFLTVKLRKVLANAESDVWEEKGYEILAYLFDYWVRNEEDVWEVFQENSLAVRVPVQSTSEATWVSADQAYFSSSWLGSDNLKIWFLLHKHPDEFEITDVATVIDKFSSLLPKLGKKAVIEKKIKGFFGCLGVRSIPAVRNYSYRGGVDVWTVVSETSKNYHQLVKKHYGAMACDWKIDGLSDYLRGSTFAQSIVLVHQILKQALKEESKYYKSRRHQTAYQCPGFPNLAIYQLFETPWIQLDISPIRTSGLYAPKECFLSKKSHGIFPTIRPDIIDSALGKEGAKKFLDSLKLQSEFSAANQTWLDWIKSLADGYESLLNSNQEVDKLNAQINEFYVTLLSQDDFSILISDDVQLPVKSSNPDEKRYEFEKKQHVLINDTSIDDAQLVSHLDGYGFGIFILGKLELESLQRLALLDLQSVSDVLQLKPEVIESHQSIQNEYVEWLTERWSIFQALHNKFTDNNSSPVIDEILSRLTIAESIEISVNLWGASDDEGDIICLDYFDTKSDDDDHNGQIYIVDDDQRDCLVEYLCNEFFGWQAKTDLLLSLMDDGNDEQKIRDILRRNKLDPNLIDQFIALNKKQLENTRREELADEQQRKLLEVVEQKKITSSSHNLASAGESKTKQNQEHNSHLQQPKSTSERSRVRSDNQGNRSRRSSRPAFGSRVSGHLRPRHAKEVIGRQYFDDEDRSNSENKRIGDLAEELVFDYLKNEVNVLNPTLLGGNNKGYDIEYTVDEETYFVEVKGLMSAWDDNDVLLSKSQFEKSQLEGDRYSIFIVEFADDDDSRQIWEIKNPNSYFTKMQLDHGWRSFSTSRTSLQPKIGRFLINGDVVAQIEDIKSNGQLIRLKLVGHEKLITYKPNKMSISEDN